MNLEVVFVVCRMIKIDYDVLSQSIMELKFGHSKHFFAIFVINFAFCISKNGKMTVKLQVSEYYEYNSKQAKTQADSFMFI